ncbi:MAG TPA: hypothetical protein PKK23_17620 [Nitrospirales bacterium]|nr:hypothetical protein [Nitrospiraceae bacterium]HNP30868.1 hypothetical protein [Nitrospirales bacterium]
MTTKNKLPTSITGEKAYKAILSRVRENHLAQKLAKEIFEFYGEFLTYSESTETLTSEFCFDIQHEPFILLEGARIVLKIDGGREAEALAHELLHLQLPIRGFPLIEGAEIPDGMTEEAAEVFMDRYIKLQNLIHHELNIANFKELGYLKRHFLCGFSPPQVDYKALVNAPQEFSWWCLEFFRHWITLRHGQSLNVGMHANDALQWGSEQHPILKQAAEGMMEWVKFGEFKNSGHYVKQVNNLLEIMKIPKVTQWAFLECPNLQRPIAKRMIV